MYDFISCDLTFYKYIKKLLLKRNPDSIFMESGLLKKNYYYLFTYCFQALLCLFVLMHIVVMFSTVVTVHTLTVVTWTWAIWTMVCHTCLYMDLVAFHNDVCHDEISYQAISSAHQLKDCQNSPNPSSSSL